MVRLGLALTLRAGKEALVRLVLTTVAVAIGVSVLVAVLADFHAYEATSNRACWECTVAAPANAPVTGSELWNYSENIYRGQFVEELRVAALGSHAPVPPGLSRLPGPGQFYASPALASLLRTVPAAQLGDRFPGRQVGTIGWRALSGPTELVAIVGSSPSALSALSGTLRVDHISTVVHVQGTTGIYSLAFGMGAIVVLFPLVILINTATRLAAARREERFAAMRLVGATPRQVAVVASVEAFVSGSIGALVGLAIFFAARPAIARISFSGQRFFERAITLTAPGYVGVVLAVPLVAVGAALWSLRRVRISPLGVTRKATPAPPRAWRVLPLSGGIALFVYPLVEHAKLTQQVSNGTRDDVVLGTFLMMSGLVIGGPWLTMTAARLLGRSASGAAPVLASRRLADNPKAAFRTVSGLVLAVFVGSLVAVIIPAFKTAESTLEHQAVSLTNVMRVPFQLGPGGGIAMDRSTELSQRLSHIPGVRTVTVYDNPAADAGRPPPQPPQGGRQPAKASLPSPQGLAGYDSILPCSALDILPALGHCPEGAVNVYASVQNDVLTDNPLEIQMPVVSPSNPVAPADLAGAGVGMMLVDAPSAASLETARTEITLFETHLPSDLGSKADTSLSAWQMGDLEAETFGEVAATRNNDLTNAENVVLAIVGLTLFGAACSLAVTTGGGIIERKRPFTLLRLSGAPASSLYRVVLLESVLPLFSASLVAAAAGVGVSIPLVKALPKLEVTGVPLPGPSYYFALGTGLVVAVAVVSTALPLLRRVTQPENARFE